MMTRQKRFYAQAATLANVRGLMDDIRKMKKAELLCYASELERKLAKAEAEIEAVRNRQIEEVRSEIKSEERKEWVETGLQMAYEELDNEIEFMADRDEISDDVAFRMRTKIRQCLDAMDVASIVG